MSRTARNWQRRQIIPNGPMMSVLGALAYLHGEGRIIFPSQAYLAQETGLTDRCVRTALAMLEALGVIERRHRSAGAKGRVSDLYQLRLERNFMFTRREIQSTRKAIRNRNVVPVAKNSLPERGSVATGTAFRGIGEEQVDTYQEGANTGQDTSIGQGGRGVVVSLRRIGGGAS